MAVETELLRGPCFGINALAHFRKYRILKKVEERAFRPVLVPPKQLGFSPGGQEDK